MPCLVHRATAEATPYFRVSRISDIYDRLSEKPPEQWAKGLPPFQVAYDEGLNVGYKWYDAENRAVLFPFGFGLSYTTYGYAGLTATQTPDCVKVTFAVTNTGARAGAETSRNGSAHGAS